MKKHIAKFTVNYFVFLFIIIEGVMLFLPMSNIALFFWGVLNALFIATMVFHKENFKTYIPFIGWK